MSKITIPNALRKCGHKEDYSANTGGTEKTVASWALKMNCSNCIAKLNKIRIDREDKAISKARSFMESKGFMDCRYSTYNDEEMVEVIIHMKGV